jgi:tetratricopeptide (TPR) repeat protein
MEGLKAQGNEHYTRGDIASALGCYQQALSTPGLSASESATLHKNLAACHLKLSQWEQAKRHCDAALEVSAVDVKALYRRALALEQLGQISAACKDMVTAAKLDPTVSGWGGWWIFSLPFSDPFYTLENLFTECRSRQRRQAAGNSGAEGRRAEVCGWVGCFFLVFFRS